MADPYKWYTLEEYAELLIEDYQDNPYKGALQDLRMLDSELVAIGGGPNWPARYEACLKRIDELFANDDEAAWDRQQEDRYG